VKVGKDKDWDSDCGLGQFRSLPDQSPPRDCFSVDIILKFN